MPMARSAGWFTANGWDDHGSDHEAKPQCLLSQSMSGLQNVGAELPEHGVVAPALDVTAVDCRSADPFVRSLGSTRSSLCSAITSAVLSSCLTVCVPRH